MTRSTLGRQRRTGRVALALVVGITLAGVAACGSDGASPVVSRTGGSAAAASSTASSPTAAPAGSPASAGTPDTATAAEQYCTEQGGQLVPRTATWNTNADPSAWLRLAGQMTLCEFEMGTGDSTTRISVDLETLYSEQPTIAAIAYLSKVKTTPPNPVGSNPAQYSCTVDLGGSSSFGNTAAGGGWVDQDQPVFVVMNLCVFADMSAIDEFGIWYHANGTIRGADLTDKFRYQPGNELPAMLAPQR